MKKIILFLALLSLGVSKAQVVGGYLPLNSTKSATMGGLRVNGNETVTGTFSVGSTATLSGDVLLGGSTNTNNYNLNLISSGSKDQQINFRRDGSTAWGLGRANTNARFGIAYNASATPTLGSGDFFSITNLGAVGIGTISPTATLDVVGNAKVSSTFSLGSANLTGGNTGTVAVLSDAVFPVTFNSSAGTNLADATTYYFGNTGWSYNTNSGQGIVTLPYNCTLVSWNYDNLVLGTLGSSEACTVQVSGTTTLNLSSVVTLSAATSNYTGTVNTNFTAGDQINIKFIAPTWGTNPTTLLSSMVLWFVRRS